MTNRKRNLKKENQTELNERKQQVLWAVVQDYAETAEPVGSRTIARKYNLGVSSATIRNEMQDLEDAGYLEQPHTSAGRIPSLLCRPAYGTGSSERRRAKPYNQDDGGTQSQTG